MSKIIISQIRQDEWVNPFSATPEELLAGALEESGLMGKHTLINNRPGTSVYQAYCKKRNRFQEATRLGSMLVKENVITNTQLNQALARQGHSNKPLGEVLLEMEFCAEQEIEQALERQKNIRDELEALELARKQQQTLWKRIIGFFRDKPEQLPEE